MAVTHPDTATRNAAADAVVDRLDLGTTDATGDLVFRTATPTVVCTCNLTNPAFGAAASGTATAATISTGTVSGATGTENVTTAQLRNRDNTAIIQCSVGTSGADINLSSIGVANGDQISISSLTYSAPA